MSNWATIKTAITDTNEFRRACERNNVQFCTENISGTFQKYEVHAELRDNGKTFGYLVKDGGSFRVMLDRDSRYRGLAKQIGDGGCLTRDYAIGVIENSITDANGMVTDKQYNPDGSVTIKCAVGY